MKKTLEIEMKRTFFTENSTTSKCFVDGNAECFMLEDKDRGLTDDMTEEEIKAIKVPGKTAMPYGRYKVIVTKSERFSKAKGIDVYLPLILGTKGFSGCRFHPGNKPEDTEGCPLPGTERATDQVTNSTTAFVRLNEKINNALKAGQDVYLTISK